MPTLPILFPSLSLRGVQNFLMLDISPASSSNYPGVAATSGRCRDWRAQCRVALQLLRRSSLPPWRFAESCGAW